MIAARNITFTSHLDVAVHRKTIRCSLPAVIMPLRTHLGWAIGLLLGPTKTLEKFLFEYLIWHVEGTSLPNY